MIFDFHNFNIQTFTQFFQAHPYSASIFAYLISFIEAMAVIGVIVPGAITMPAIGFLIGSNIIPAGSTFMWASLGAITGDCLSYLLGVYFQNRIHRIWPFTRWPDLLARSEKFFHNHGGKSIFIGRFVGPMRAMIPMIAGMLKMSFVRFLFAAIPSAIIWAIGYMVPGILLGVLSLELPAKVATKFVIGAFLTIVALWFIFWLVKHFFKNIWEMLDYYVVQFWKYLQKHKSTFYITKFLSDPKEPDNHLQLFLMMVVVFISILFLWVLNQIIMSGVLVDFSYSVYHLLSSLRIERLDNIFVLITFLGDVSLLLIVSGIISLWLLYERRWYAAVHLLGVVMLGGVMIAGMKILIHSPCPGDILYSDIYASSFPSAHAALSVSFYGFLAVMLIRELKSLNRYFVYIIAGGVIALISFSRIYLGAHWLVDILGGILFGFIIMLIITISYRRRHVLHPHLYKFILVIISVIFAVWVGYSTIEFKKQIKKYTLVWPEKTVTFNNLLKETPLYRLNRLGHAIEAFNVVYIGNLSEISRILLDQDWEPQPVSLDFQNIVKSFSATSIVNHLTIFPQLYHNRKIALLLTKSTDNEGEVLILRLWRSDVKLKDNDLPVWIGTIECHRSTSGVFSIKNFKKKKLFVGDTELLAKYLGKRSFYFWRRYYQVEQQPPEMRELHWDGKLLIVEYKVSRSLRAMES